MPFAESNDIGWVSQDIGWIEDQNRSIYYKAYNTAYKVLNIEERPHDETRKDVEYIDKEIKKIVRKLPKGDMGVGHARILLMKIKAVHPVTMKVELATLINYYSGTTWADAIRIEFDDGHRFAQTLKHIKDMVENTEKEI